MSLDVYIDEEWIASVTHNLNKMAQAAGIYDLLWHPKKAKIKIAEQLIQPLIIALQDLRANEEKYSKYNAPNGWGTHSGLITFMEHYLLGCIKYPTGEIRASI